LQPVLCCVYAAKCSPLFSTPPSGCHEFHAT
jgi:hypothetical protein